MLRTETPLDKQKATQERTVTMNMTMGGRDEKGKREKSIKQEGKDRGEKENIAKKRRKREIKRKR
jgi:hypothetical protein